MLASWPELIALVSVSLIVEPDELGAFRPTCTCTPLPACAQQWCQTPIAPHCLLTCQQGAEARHLAWLAQAVRLQAGRDKLCGTLLLRVKPEAK